MKLDADERIPLTEEDIKRINEICRREVILSPHLLEAIEKMNKDGAIAQR